MDKKLKEYIENLEEELKALKEKISDVNKSD